jgi:hypothetical protein
MVENRSRHWRSNDARKRDFPQFLTFATAAAGLLMLMLMTTTMIHSSISFDYLLLRLLLLLGFFGRIHFDRIGCVAGPGVVVFGSWHWLRRRDFGRNRDRTAGLRAGDVRAEAPCWIASRGDGASSTPVPACSSGS